jgi:hypothetical protein
MGEKRGNTGKLIFEFNPLAALEVQYSDGDERWFRVSAEHFRAFDGKRRITEPAEVIKGSTEVRMKTYQYDGPVYAWGTNKKVIKQNLGKLISSPVYEQALANSKKRGK